MKEMMEVMEVMEVMGGQVASINKMAPTDSSGPYLYSSQGGWVHYRTRRSDVLRVS